MARSTRLLSSATVPSTTTREPTSVVEWSRLARKAIARAQASKDNRLAVLQDALAKDKIPQTLKSLGIICDNDILREFPKSET